MSVFRQLMMKRFHSAANYMDLTVVGSPTISNGVASGFSANNYLISSQNFNPDNNIWEICIKFNMFSSNGSASGLLFPSSSGNSIALYITSDNILQFSLSSNGYSWDIVSGYNLFTLNLNTDYKLKIKFTGFSYDVYSYENNEWVIKASFISSVAIVNTKGIVLGNTRPGTNIPFNGSIDLVNSYIKINNTKYQFRFIMPLTVVGSPTITDSVVSGFSNSNYLTASKPSSITTFELNIKFSFSSLSSYQFIFGDNLYNGIQFQKNDDTNNTIRLRCSNGSSGYYIDILPNPLLNTNYIFNIKINGTTAIVSYQVEGQQIVTNTYALNYAPVFGTSKWIFGKRNPGFDEPSYLLGSIDINNSYIKINGTKYILTLPQEDKCYTEKQLIIN